MAISEFSLIQQYFSELTEQRYDVAIGIGDDCAVLTLPVEKQLAVSIDTLVAGVHFFADVSPETLGYKSLAVGLSDLAAMGAVPAWFTLALTLPEANTEWLELFCRGLSRLAKQHNIQLIGGDTTRGPLAISIQVHGFVDKDKALRRDGAQLGDLIYVSGTIGDAGAALQRRLNNWQPGVLTTTDWLYLQQRLETPTPRNVLSEVIVCYANSAIDISDGLLADLGHILENSGVGAAIHLDRLPLSSSLQKLADEEAIPLALSSGDDYELCFTVPAGLASKLEAETDMISCIGKITQGKGIELLDTSGQSVTHQIRKGYDHFTA